MLGLEGSLSSPPPAESRDDEFPEVSLDGDRRNFDSIAAGWSWQRLPEGRSGSLSHKGASGNRRKAAFQLQRSARYGYPVDAMRQTC